MVPWIHVIQRCDFCWAPASPALLLAVHLIAHQLITGWVHWSRLCEYAKSKQQRLVKNGIGITKQRYWHIYPKHHSTEKLHASIMGLENLLEDDLNAETSDVWLMGCHPYTEFLHCIHCGISNMQVLLSFTKPCTSSW